MADFDRNAEFRRNLRQLRELRAQGYAFESVPLGGDALSRGDPEQSALATANLARFTREQRELGRKQKTLEQKVHALEARVRNIRNPSRQTLMDKLKADGFGVRSERQKLQFGPVKLGRGGLRLDTPRLTGGAFTSYAILAAMDQGVAAVMDGIDTYKRLKREGRSEREAKEALLGSAAEAATGRMVSTLGSVPLVGSAQRVLGLDPDRVKHMWTRMIANYANKGELTRREQAAGNAELKAQADFLNPFINKMNSSGPRTFRLRNAREAEAFRRERIEASEAALASERSRNELKRRNGRDASGN